MEKVFFAPWVGEKYISEGYFGKKILILGKSHHCGEKCKDRGILSANHECKDFTASVMSRYLSHIRGREKHSGRMKTFTRFTNIFYGKPINDEILIDFRNSIVFHNHVQKSTGGTRIAPCKKDFLDSENAFFDILNIYRPNLIIVRGQRLRDNTPETGEWGNDKISDNNGGYFFYHKVKGMNIPAYFVNHPSSSAFDHRWSPYL